MEAIEVLAITRLRQWATMRTANQNGKATSYRRDGWRERRASEADARLVAVIDFERVLAKLTVEEQMILVQRYRDRYSDEQIARTVGCSVRKVGYVLVSARRALTSLLDRANML